MATIASSPNAMEISTSSEPAKQRQTSSTKQQATNEPQAIAAKLCQMFKSLIPAITLPDHAPVNGRGIATNPAKIISFFSVEVCSEIAVSLPEKCSCAKPVRKRFFNFLTINIIGIAGIMLPTNAHKNAITGESGSTKISLSANGIATLHSSPGMSETNITASHSQLEKAEANDVSMISPF